jgi:hypothetical protein
MICAACTAFSSQYKYCDVGGGGGGGVDVDIGINSSFPVAMVVVFGVKLVLFNSTSIATAIKWGACNRNVSLIGNARIISKILCFNSCCCSYDSDDIVVDSVLVGSTGQAGVVVDCGEDFIGDANIDGNVGTKTHKNRV